ncbi:tRNA-dihydrouridine synthase [Desulfospira joergensenii]|uniref:oxidoreductase n=1 Tax=Desulfospira joergensenii TaxID=53329 RepID=UPI0003B499ED|nr:NADH:flavin oxidoreductase [Desulfospira joergensenii]
MIQNLFEPVEIKGIQLKNRFVRSATMEGMGTPDGYPTQKLKEYYCRLAQGEVGLIFTHGTMIEAWKNLPETLGIQSPFSIHSDRYINAWQDVVHAVHAGGAKIAMQISHLGRQDIPELRGSAPIAPSAVPIEESGVTPRQMGVDDIENVIESFAQACRRVKEAGFDAVQFHGAHGNLINNFMSPFTNIRTDHYGGPLENRARFMTDILKRTRQVIGPEYPLMIKMNFNDFVDGGLETNEAVNIAGIIAEAGIDCIEVSGGTLSESRSHIAVKGIKKKEQEAYFREYAKALKEQVSIPVILVGGHRSPDLMARIVEEGTADFISMSRPFIREPGLIQRWKKGDLEKAKCISCNQCFENWISRPLRCYVDNPVREKQ